MSKRLNDKPIFKDPGLLLNWIGVFAKSEAEDDIEGHRERTLRVIAVQCERYANLKTEKPDAYPKPDDLLLYILEGENQLNKNPIYYKDLARWTGFKISTVSRALDKLKSRGLVQSNNKGGWWPTNKGKLVVFNPWKKQKKTL